MEILFETKKNRDKQIMKNKSFKKTNIILSKNKKKKKKKKLFAVPCCTLR
jgi:hypothetical protein